MTPLSKKVIHAHMCKHRFKYYPVLAVCSYKLYHITHFAAFHESFSVIACVVFEHVFAVKGEE